MSPLLNKETELNIVIGKIYKFINDNGIIAYEEQAEFDRTKPLHIVVAGKYRLGTPDDFDPGRLEVDDAGFLERQENDRLLFWGQSGSCRPRDKEEARPITQQLAQQLTGKEIDVEEGIW